MGLKDLELYAQQESQHSQATSAVGQSLNQGLDQNPDEYAELLKLSARTGIAPPLAKDFKPQLTKRDRISSMSIDDMVRTNPKTSQFLADPENASVAHDDVGVLKTIEDTVRAVPAGLSQGWDKQRQMFLNYKEVMGNISPSERAELAKLDELAKQRSKEYSSGLPSWFKAASDVVGMSANSLLDAAKYEGTIGLGTGAATGAALGAIGGPMAPVTATAGGAAGAGVGFKAGMTTGMVINTYESSVGEVYDDLKNFKMPDGTKLDPNVARYAAVVAGVPNTALETFALGKALKLVPFADKVIGTIGREQMKEILVRPTMRAAMAEIGTKYAVAVGSETFTEGLQKFVSILAREASISATPDGKGTETPQAGQRQGRAYDENQLRDDAKAIVDEATEAFKATVVLGGMGGGVKTYQARQEVKKAEQNQAVFEAIGKTATESNLNKRYPEKFQQFVEQATKDGPVQNVYIGSQEFSTFFQSQGVDPEQVALEAGVTNYREAMAGGSDLVVPLSQFASKIAPSQYLQGLMPDLRLRQGDMSLRESQLYQQEQEARDAEMLARMDEIVAEQQAAGGFSRAVQDIMTDMEGQLLSIGMTNQMARDEAVKLRGVAVLVERDLKERASRESRDVSDQEVQETIQRVWERYGLTINRKIPDVLTTAPTSDISIDPLLDSLRAGSFPTDREIFGRGLAEFIRDSGGILPSGETLTAQENMERRPFQKNLVQAKGMSLDKALEAAVQAGYFPNQSTGTLTEADFLNALDEDLRGNGVYSVNETNNNALAIREAMNSLGEYLDSLGIDLQAITNNAGVRRLLDNARRDPALEGIVNELEQFVTQLNQSAAPLAPNGKPSNLSPELHALVRTPEFKAWFGDWEKFATMDGGVWNDANGEVSKAVDENGEPMVLYHGTDAAGFTAFNTPAGGKRGDLGIFLTPNRAMAQTYVKRGVGKDLTREQVLAADGEKISGIYPLFANIRNPYETDFEGANWNGERPQQFEIFDENGDKLYDDTGKGYFTDEELDAELARLDALNISAKAEPAPEHFESTDSAVREARNSGNDGAIIRNVVDDGGGASSYASEPSDVFVALEDVQVKSVENFGSFDANNSNMFYQTDTAGFKKWSHGHEVIAMDESHEYKAGEGVVVEAVHGTTGDFDTFEQIKANIESDLGGGFYFTNNVADVGENYAGLGPDLTQKVELLAERIASETDREYNDPDVVAEARAQFMANEGFTMPVYVRFDNPVVIGGSQETFLDYSEQYNEETEEYGEPEGKLVEFVEALREVAGEYTDADADGAMGAVWESVNDNEGISVSELIEKLKASESLAYATDDNGTLASTEIIRRAFEQMGFDGFIDQTVNQKFGSEKKVGKAMAGMDENTVHFIAFNPTQIKSRLGNNGEFSETDPNILKQGNDDKRGFIQFDKQRKFNITLLEKANASTVTHELGHFYLEVLGDLATAEGAGESITKDYQTILEFLGATSRDDLTLDGKAKGSAEYNKAVEMHEKFARANEAYWMEGKAPSPELQGVFQRFKDFLKLIYKQIQALDVKLNDDVRAVFDRIYATDAEIESAKEQINVDPIFLTAEEAGMTEQEFALYRKSVSQATESGKEALLAKLMREMQRDRKTWWKEEREKMHAEVTKEVDEQPVYRAFAALIAGQVDEDTPVKLNKQALIDRYGADYVKRMPRSFGRIYTTTGGMDADSAAEMLGYDSGDKLIEALVGMRDRKELIEAETDVRMLQKHGDMLNDGTIADEAKIALHNAERENVLMAELRALRRKQREVKPFVQAERNKQRADRQQARAATEVPPTEAFRRAAQDVISKTAPRDISPYTYLQAARKAAKQAFSAMAKGDYQLAADAKQKELLNHHLYLEAVKAREEADKILTYAKKFEKGTTREKMGKAGADYLEQIDALLDRYEFRRVPLSKLDRRASLIEWVNQQEAAGNEPSISPVLLNEARQVNYREVPMSELRAIYDAVRNIEHLARYKNKLMAKQAEIAFDDAIAELVAAAENMTAGAGDKAVGERKPLPLDMSAMTMREKAGDTVSRLDGMLVKMEQIVEWLDNGNVNGPWHTYIWNPITEAQDREYDLTRQLTERLATSLEKMPKEQRLAMLDTFEVAGMGKVTRKFLISVALNMGNQGNIDKMMRGMGWSMDTIEGALAKLNDADWTFVQDTWDTINSVWPEIAALEKRMTGLEPPKVEAQPYQVRDANGNVTRTLAGGYYPLVYDPRKSEQGAKQEGGNLGQLFEEGYVRATTPKGHTQARMDGFAAPFLFDFEQVVTQHMAKVVKDLTHREAVVQANKILTNPEIRNVLQETMGPAYEKQFLPWLRSVVNDRNGGSVQGLSDFSRWMMSARANVVAATMGFKATTMIAQITGISQSFDKVKGRYLGQALLEYLRHPIALTRQVRELSGEMRNRSNTLDRDIRDQLRNLTGQNSKWAQAQRFAFHGIAIADAMVTIPTWMGAYRQALDQGADEATARLEADAAVRMTQGAGGAKDLAAIQRNNELAKSLTMFYSYFSVLYNRMRDMGREVQEIRDMPRFLARVFFTVMVPAILGELILGRGPDDDEDPAAWAIRKVLLYPMMSVPVLRDVVSSIDSGFDYRFSPMATLFDKVGKAATATGKLFTDDIEWGDYSLKVAETIGYVFGVAGTAQMSATGKYLWRVSEGEEQPENLAELLAYALLGKRKED